MTERRARWTLLAIAGVASAILSMAPTEARAVVRACCLANGTCEMLNRSTCEGQVMGTSQAIGTTCDTVTCPLLCSAAGAECNGQCPAGDTCVLPQNGVGTTSALALCLCVPEIPLGGACDQQPDACAPGLECENGFCALAPAPAPLMSTAGMALAVATLIGLGGLASIRRRRHH